MCTLIIAMMSFFKGPVHLRFGVFIMLLGQKRSKVILKKKGQRSYFIQMYRVNGCKLEYFDELPPDFQFDKGACVNVLNAYVLLCFHNTASRECKK